MTVDASLPGATILKMLAPGQAPTHEIVRSDGVVIAKGSQERLEDLAAWLSETPVDGDARTYAVRPKQRGKR